MFFRLYSFFSKAYFCACVCVQVCVHVQYIGSELGVSLLLLRKITCNCTGLCQHMPRLNKDEIKSQLDKSYQKPADSNSLFICYYSASIPFHKGMIAFLFGRLPLHFNFDSQNHIIVNSYSYYSLKLLYPLMHIL